MKALTPEQRDAIYDEFEFAVYDDDLSTAGIKLMRLENWLNENTEKGETMHIPFKNLDLPYESCQCEKCNPQEWQPCPSYLCKKCGTKLINNDCPNCGRTNG